MSDVIEINAEVNETEALTADVSTNEDITVLDNANVDEVVEADISETETLSAEVASTDEFIEVGLDESYVRSGGGGTTDYNDLINKPQIEGVTLIGNKMFPELNLNVLTNSEIQTIFDNLI